MHDSRSNRAVGIVKVAVEERFTCSVFANYSSAGIVSEPVPIKGSLAAFGCGLVLLTYAEPV